ncbi:MAG: response regulator, partial [Nitrospinales bacterium]
VAKEIQMNLERSEYQVVAKAASGKEAVGLAKEHRPDLMLMDIRLKGEMDGIETARQIHLRYDIPVIYLSAFANLETLTRAKTTEPYGYIIKPYDDHILRTTVARALRQHDQDKKRKKQEPPAKTCEPVPASLVLKTIHPAKGNRTSSS